MAVADSQRNIHAPSGWVSSSSSSYGSARVAAPLAILGYIYQSMQMVLSTGSQASFPPLIVNWSILNKAASGDKGDGDIVTSNYNNVNGNLYILGDKDSDTDEYDDHVIAHEWGHYYEDKFSRSDNIGGPHSSGDHLDIRVAFGEGFCNAVSGIALKDPIYFDTLGDGQSNGWSMNLESQTANNNPGWYSEASIQRIIYDLYDSNDDGSDILSLGFTPLHNTFAGVQKNTQAFTSIFSFITALKSENIGISGKIDSIVSSESIVEITDIYGNNRTNTPYSDLAVGGTVNVCTSDTDGRNNKLSNRRYVKFTVASSATYTIKAEQTNGSDSDSDPDFFVYQASPFSYKESATGAVAGVEEKNFLLSAGEHLLDIVEHNNITDRCFDITVTPTVIP